jgi:FkbM family methyltransferase
MFRYIFVKYFNFLGKYKRFFIALKDVYIYKSKYSQHGEDVFFLDYINKKNIRINDYIYIDVGANHPTDISNTFLLYKNGMNGFIIEPNLELLNLFKFFRRKDLIFPIGVSNESNMSQFFISKTPVLSSFKKDWRNSEISVSYYVPIMTLDDALRNNISKPIFLISIDVEGLNKEVLEGAIKVISKSLLVCIEFENINDKINYCSILGPSFKPLIDLGCNTIFENIDFSI